MRSGIRSRLVLAFVLIIAVPVAVTLSTLSLTMLQAGRSVDSDQVDQFQQVNQSISQSIVRGYDYVGDYDRFRQDFEPLIAEYGLHLRIISTGGVLLFDSEDQEGSEQGHYVDGFEPSETSKIMWVNAGSSYRATLPVVVDGRTVSHAVVSLDYEGQPFNAVRSVFISLGVSLGLGLLTLIILIIMFTWYISRTVLKPLNELNSATESIARGDLDFEITYRAEDELGRFSRTFDGMRARLKESLEKQHLEETLRKEMISSISHDLRTPIASIKGYVEGLQDGVAGDEAMFKRYLAVIRDKTGQLDRLIDDLFQFSQMDADRLEIRPEPADSRELLEEILGGIELSFARSPIKFTVERPLPSVPVYADRYRLEQVLSNLVGNAARYAGDNGVIKVSACGGEDQLIVSVEDNGPGIPEADLPHIFERFYRGEKSRSREYGGAGLGLPICKHIVEVHGGRIWVESRPGGGSIFRFSLGSGHFLNKGV